MTNDINEVRRDLMESMAMTLLRVMKHQGTWTNLVECHKAVDDLYVADPDFKARIDAGALDLLPRHSMGSA
jgi:hypothetical protein